MRNVGVRTNPGDVANQQDIARWSFGTGNPSDAAGAQGDYYVGSDNKLWSKGTTTWTYTGVQYGSSAAVPDKAVPVDDDILSIGDSANSLQMRKLTFANLKKWLYTLLFGFSGRNRLINSDFSVNQRGASGTVALAAGAFGHDRWRAGSSGCTYTFSTTNNVTTITISSGSLQQVIEGARLDSGTHVLSWSGTAQGRVGSGSYGASGLTASVTGGTNTTIEFGIGTLTQPQFEPGTAATSPEKVDPEKNLAACKRFYQAYWGASTGGATFAARGAPGGGNGIYFNSVLQVEMRAAPTATVVGPFTTSNCGQPVLNAATKNTITLVGNCAANGDAYFFSTSTSVGFTLNAELP